MLKAIEYAIVAKVDVADMEASVEWYASKLDLIPDPRYIGPTWRQCNLPNIQQAAIGLNYNPTGIGTGGAVTTFVVVDIEQACQELITRGVVVGPITPVGEGVLLAFFRDPDGNQLGLRQID